MKQNFVAQFVQLLKCWLCYVRSGVVLEKNWAHPVDQCQLPALQFSVNLTDLLSILLRCSCFTGIQKAVVHQTSRRSPNSGHSHFFLVNLALGRALEHLLGPATEPFVIYSPLSVASHNPVEKWFVIA